MCSSSAAVLMERMRPSLERETRGAMVAFLRGIEKTLVVSGIPCGMTVILSMFHFICFLLVTSVSRRKREA